MNETNDELIKQQIDSFPILPATVSRIMEVTANPESSASDLMQAMLPDQSLCVTVLKLANSVLFGRPQRVDSLDTAIMVLGFNEVQSIALTKAMLNSFRELNLVDSTQVEQFWEHSFLTAMAAKRIAQDLRLPLGTLFMAGLIHDIGKLVMLLTFDSEYDPEAWMIRISTGELLVSEYRRFGFNHAAVGGQLLRQWNFPENLLAAVEHHHRPAKAPLEQHIAQVIQLADLLSHFSLEDGIDADASPTSRLQTFLPDLITRWRGMGLAWDDERLEFWQTWLFASREQSRSIRSIFSA